MDPFRYWMPTEVVLGVGCLSALGERCRGLGGKALVVTGKHAARASGALDRALAQLPAAAVFDAVEENPSIETCGQGAALCRENGCDVVVGLGGGSAMDAAKAIALLAVNPGGCEAYLAGEAPAHPHLPIVAVPTTAGTGSEVTPYAVLVETRPPSANARRLNKRTLRNLFPAVALLDPELSVTMPRAVTVSTGLDALSQAMEGMVSRKATPIGDIAALETCRIVGAWLPRAAADARDLQARAGMLYAAMLSGITIAQSGTTLVHGMGYYFTLEYGVPHGLANALLLTPVFQYNARRVPQAVAAIAAALGLPCEATATDAATAIADALHALLAQLGISPAARDAGVDVTRLRWCAEQVFADRGRFKNQPGEPTLEEVHGFFQQACDGEKR